MKNPFFSFFYESFLLDDTNNREFQRQGICFMVLITDNSKSHGTDLGFIPGFNKFNISNNL